MKSLIFVKKIDELGRIVVPKDVRRALGVTNLDWIEFVNEGDAIVIKKYTENCCFCSSLEDLILFKDKHVCKKCRDEMLGA